MVFAACIQVESHRRARMDSSLSKVPRNKQELYLMATRCPNADPERGRHSALASALASGLALELALELA